MSAATATAVAVVQPDAAPGLTGAVLRHAVRLVRRGAVIVGFLAAGMSAVVVQQHRRLFADSADLVSLEALATNPAIRIMFGRPVALADPGGFTVWRTGTPLAMILMVWAMLVVLRITRGDEEAGRWDLLLAGRYRLSRLIALHVGVVVAVTMLVGTAVTVAMATAGADIGGSVRYGLALALIGVGAAAWGALVGQLIADRRRAATLGAAGISAALLARMVADGVGSLAWWQWLTPFGLLGLAEPFAANRTMPLMLLALGAAIPAAAAVVTSRRRDLHGGLIHGRASTAARPLLLRSLARFAARRSRGPVVAWGAGVWLYCLIIGVLASSVTTFLAENRVFADLAAQAGFGELTTVAGYVASLFALLAIPIGLFAASRVSANADDEEARLLTLVFSAPVSRRRWYLTETAAALVGATVIAIGAGAATWVGAAAVDADVPGLAAVAGTLNVLPIAWLSLGAALLAYGWWPYAVLPVGALPAAGGFVLQVFAESFHWPDWVLWFSPYQHINAVPYESVNWAGTTGMTLLAITFAVLGLVGFTRRDLRG